MLKLPQLNTRQIDGLNIGLMVISLILAYALPFEMFLFSYAVLGPLHYLTEITWLHRKNYYVPGKKDFIFFLVAAVVLGMLITASNYWQDIFGAKSSSPVQDWGANVILMIFACGFILVVLKKTLFRIIAFAGLILITVGVNLEGRCTACTNPQTNAVEQICGADAKAEKRFVQKHGVDTTGDGYIDNCRNEAKFPFILAFFTAYLPTLIHVYIFTMLFMLFGSLKSRSKLGYIAVCCLVIFGIVPFVFQPDFGYTVSGYARNAYDVSFLSLNQIVFQNFNLGAADPDAIYTSKIGISLTRFIAFAYTYHYLNWFSKTSIIQWHKMPVLNLSVVILLWVGAVALYAIDYKLGLSWLFFLSFLHVFMEFPLNWQSIVGIGTSLFVRKKVKTA